MFIFYHSGSINNSQENGDYSSPKDKSEDGLTDPSGQKEGISTNESLQSCLNSQSNNCPQDGDVSGSETR